MLDDTVNRVVVEKMVVEMVDKVVKEGTEETQQEKETLTEGKSAVQWKRETWKELHVYKKDNVQNIFDVFV